ncbi:hypothetical protein BTVI_41375 [Pitangus sulphuratus]|nr:hypothetical protein BTVI_41375 [Pitangus sulphuratus]
MLSMGQPSQGKGKDKNKMPDTRVTADKANSKGQNKSMEVAHIQKKKYKTKSACPVDDDGEAGPSQADNPEPEIITESLSYDNLWSLCADVIRRPNEPILTWMIRVWDSMGDAINLDGSEARLIQVMLEKGEALEHLQYIDDIIIWGDTAEEVSEKGQKITQILLGAGFAIKKSKVKGPAQEIHFLGKDLREDPENYKPLRLTPVPGKIMEKIIQGTIERHFKNNAIIRHSQHGFTKAKPCLTDLISFYDMVTHLVKEGKVVDLVFLDFIKAFHTVLHSILLDRLSNCEMIRYTVHWEKNWLNVRAQSVLGNGATSGWQLVFLGPVLFNIFINDLDAGVQCTINKFAGDSKLGGAGDSLEGQEAFQKDLDRFEHWAIINGMKFTKSKCQIPHLGQQHWTEA